MELWPKTTTRPKAINGAFCPFQPHFYLPHKRRTGTFYDGETGPIPHLKTQNTTFLSGLPNIGGQALQLAIGSLFLQSEKKNSYEEGDTPGL